MGEYYVSGPLSGQQYRYRIRGESPSADEQRRINADVRQQEFEFGQRFEQTMGRALPGMEGEGVMDLLGEIPKGIGRGAVGMFEQAALGAAAALPESAETPIRQGIMSVSDWATRRLQPDIGFQESKPAEIVGGLSEGLGSFGALALTSLLPGGLAAPLAVGAAAGAGEASERARASGATPEERAVATAFGLPVGASNVYPLRRLERALGQEFTGTILNRLRRIAAQAGVEGAQEAAAEIAQNLIAQQVYDPETGLLTGTGEALGYGAGVGGIVQALMDVTFGRRTRTPSPAQPSTPPSAQPSTPPSAQPPTPPSAQPPGGPMLQRELKLDYSQTRPGFFDGDPQGDLFVPRSRPPATVPQGPDTRPTSVGQQGVQVNPAVAEDFDVATTLSALRAADGNYPAAMSALGITYSEMRQRVRHLESLGLITFDRASGKMAIAEPQDTGAPTPPLEAYADQYAPSTSQLELPLEPTGTPATTPTQPTGEMDVEAEIRNLQARAQETADAQTTEPGSVPPDGTPDRTGPESGLSVPDLGDAPPDAGTAGAQPPVGRAVGEPVLGAPEPAAPEGAQRAPLREPSDDIDLDRLSPRQRENLKRGIRPDLTMAGVEPRPIPPIETPADPSVTLDGYNPVTGALPGQTTTLPGGPAPTPRISDPPVRAQPETGAAVDPGAARRAPSDLEGMTRVLDELGVGPRAGIRQQVRRGEIATPEAFIQALERTRMPKAAAEARDAWVQNAREQMEQDARARQDDPAVARVVREMEEIRATNAAKQSIAEWFDANASEDLRLADDLAATTSREPVQLSSTDLRAIGGLLQQVRKDKGGKQPNPAQAAFRYFGRTADPLYALHMLASDAAEAIAPPRVRKLKDGTEKITDVRVGKYRTRQDILEQGRHGDDVVLSAQERADVALLEGQGWGVAETALQWAEANLSSAAYQQLIALRDGPYKWVDYSGRARVRDRAKGATEGGRVGPARTVDELTDAELKVRKAALARDQQAVEDAARKWRGLTQEQWNALPPDVRREHVLDYQDLRDLDYDAPRVSLPPVFPSAGLIGNGAGTTQWLSSAHPTVVARVASGDFRGAVRLMGATAGNAHLRALAQKLLPRLQDATRSRMVSAAELAAIKRTLNPEASVDVSEALYVRRFSSAEIAALRAEGRDGAADIVEQLQDTVVVSEDSTVSNELLLHEAVHAVAAYAINNPSHPFGRQLETLRVKLAKFMPSTFYGLKNKHELLSEGLTNPEFRKALSSVNVDGNPYPAWEQFKHSARNWLRSIMGLPPKSRDSVLDTLDDVIDAIIAVNPNEIAAGDLYGAAFYAAPMRGIVERSMAATRVPTKADMALLGRTLRDTGIPAAWKNVLVRAAMPLDYVTDAATKYFPSANRVHDALLGHQATIKRKTDEVNQTIAPIADFLKKYRNDPSWAENTQRFLFQGTINNVNVQKPVSEYEGYTYRYTVVDPTTGRAQIKESKRFKTEDERNKAIAAYNRALPPNALRSERARRGFDMDPEQLAEYRRLRPIYDRMIAQDASYAGVLSRAFAMPVQMGKDLQDAIRARLDALIPNQKNLQNRIFGEIYNKILAEQLIDPYQPLRREGDYWLSYRAIDPESVEYDAAGRAIPGTGRIELVKHAFNSEFQRNYAIQQLRALPDDQKVTDIRPYQNVGGQRNRDRVPMEFVARVLDSIEGAEALQGDANAALRGQIIELMFDTLPETSFVQSFRRRANVRGFIADMTPITGGMVPGDLMSTLRENSLRVGRQVADLRYGAEFSAIRTALDKESAELQERTDLTAGQKAEAAQYFDVLLDYTRAPFKHRSMLSRRLTAGTFFMTLGFNPSTALITLSQVPLFAFPMLAGKYGMRTAMGAIGSAHRLLTGSGRYREVQRVGEDGQMETVRVPTKIWEFSLQNYDFTDAKYAYLKALNDVGEINGAFNRSLIQDELLAETATKWDTLVGYSSLMQHTAERYSRETSMIAAYHLELQKLMGASGSVDSFAQQIQRGEITPTQEQMQAAAEYAVDAAEKINGPIYAAAGPVWSQGDIGSVAYLFKRHPLAMLNLYVQTIKRSLPSNADPEDMRVARRQTAGLVGMMGLMGGAMGIPFMQQLGWLYDWLWADDDELDFESMMRINLGEAGAFGLVDFLTGFKVADRIGLGAAVYRPAFGADQLPLSYQILEGIAGPVVGVGGRFINRAPQLAAEGRWDRFAEAVTPSSMANILRAARFSREGALTARGDPIVQDFSPLSLFGQAFGFMPAEYAQQLAINSMGSRINNAIDTKRTQLLSRRYRAYREGDWETLREIDQEIDAFNQRHPRNRIDAETKRNSLRSNQQTTSRMNHGIAINPRNLQYVQALSDAYGQSSIWQ